jgi:preprotein translocase subunit Sec63
VQHPFFCALQKKITSAERFLRKFFTVQNVVLGVLWLIWLALVVYVQTQAQDMAPFDPYEILKVKDIAMH